MEKKQTWDEIQKQYDGEWVLLDDYEWPESAEYPQAGIVRIPAKPRAEFDRLISARAAGVDSALVFVGAPARSADTVTTRGSSRVEFGAS